MINIIGSFLIGLIAAAAAKNGSLNPRIILFLKVGICGGFTTFSSFALETGDLVKNGNVGIAVLYAVLSMVLGVAAVFGGIGSIPGAFLGGILLGIIENLSKAYISTQLSDAIVFLVLIVVLIVKPTGLLGKKVNVKV